MGVFVSGLPVRTGDGMDPGNCQSDGNWGEKLEGGFGLCQPKGWRVGVFELRLFGVDGWKEDRSLKGQLYLVCEGRSWMERKYS